MKNKNIDDEWEDDRLRDWIEEEDLSVTEDEFDSLDDILCETCGEPCEHRHLLEDADFGTILQVCINCATELSEGEPDRFTFVGDE